MWLSTHPPPSSGVTNANGAQTPIASHRPPHDRGSSNVPVHLFYNELVTGIGGGGAVAPASPRNNQMKRVGSAHYDAVTSPVSVSAPPKRKYVSAVPHKHASDGVLDLKFAPSPSKLSPTPFVPSPEAPKAALAFANHLQHIPPHVRPMHAATIESNLLLPKEYIDGAHIPTAAPVEVGAALRASRLQLSQQSPNIVGPI